MNNQVGPQVKAPLQHGTRKRIVADANNPVLSGNVGYRRNVGNLQQRIGRSFNQDEFRVTVDFPLDVFDVRHVNEGGLQLPAGQRFIEQFGRAVVNVLGDNHVVSGRQGLENAHYGGHAGGERRRGCSAFQVAYALLQQAARRVSGAAVGKIQRIRSILGTLKGGGHMDRRGYPAGGGIDGAPAVNRQRLDSHARSCSHARS